MDTITGNILQGDVDATLFGNPTLVDGVRGKALSFNGVDQYAEIDPHQYVMNFKVVSQKQYLQTATQFSLKLLNIKE